VVLTNRATGNCTMFGFPGLGLLDPNGSAQTLDVKRVEGPLAGEPAIPKTRVTLDAGASASFWVEWSAGAGSTTGTLIVTPPNQTTHLSLPDPGIPLDVGMVSVSPVGLGVVAPARPLPVPAVAISGPYADQSWGGSTPYTSLQIPVVVVQMPQAGPGQLDPAYFWSTEFSPVGSCGCANGDGGYVGLQDDKNGQRVIFSWWSSLRASSTNPAATISKFSNEGTGIQVRLPYAIVQGHGYQLRLSRTSTGGSTTTWQAVVTDTTTGTTNVVGAIAVPSAWGTFLRGATTSFTEYYGPRASDCRQLPATEAAFGPVTMNGGLEASGLDFHYGNVGSNGCPSLQQLTGPGTYVQQMGSPAPG
jgi:hypothetical protein